MEYADIIQHGTLEDIEAYLTDMYEEYSCGEGSADDIRKLEMRRVELKLKECFAEFINTAS
jgi:hypothetical protein